MAMAQDGLVGMPTVWVTTKLSMGTAANRDKVGEGFPCFFVTDIN